MKLFASLLIGFLILGPQQSPTGRIDGRVTIEGSGAILIGVEVTAKNDARRYSSSTTTDSQGRFSFNGLRNGNYRFEVRVENYRLLPRRVGDAQYGYMFVNLSSDNAVERCDIVLRPTGSINGALTDQYDRPISGMTVRAYRLAYDFYGNPLLAPAGTGKTDSRGEYSIRGIDAGSYFVRAEPDGASVRQHAPTFYPGSSEASSAASVKVLALSSARADFRVEPSPLTKISGTFINQVDTEEVVRSILVVPQDMTGAQPYTMLNSTTKNRRQFFELEGLLPGAYELFPIFPPQPTSAELKRYSARVQVQVGRDTSQEVKTPITFGHRLDGKFLIRDNAVQLERWDFLVGLSIRHGWFSGSGGGVNVDEEDGSFYHAGLADREYYLEVGALGPSWYVDKAMLNGEDVLHKAFRIDRASRLEITLDPSGSQVTGKVAEPATVVLVPVRRLGDNPRNSFYWAKVDKNGTFILAGVRPGEYRLLALIDVPDNAYLNEDFIRQYERRGAPVRIERGSRAVIDPPVLR